MKIQNRISLLQASDYKQPSNPYINASSASCSYHAPQRGPPPSHRPRQQHETAWPADHKRGPEGSKNTRSLIRRRPLMQPAPNALDRTPTHVPAFPCFVPCGRYLRADMGITGVTAPQPGDSDATSSTSPLSGRKGNGAASAAPLSAVDNATDTSPGVSACSRLALITAYCVMLSVTILSTYGVGGDFGPHHSLRKPTPITPERCVPVHTNGPQTPAGAGSRESSAQTGPGSTGTSCLRS